MKDSTLKHGFAQWAAKCLKCDNADEKCAFDVPHIANIFQALCFEVKHFDVSTDEDVDPHKIRIVITCNRSGQRCVLERTDDDTCACLKHEYESIPEGYFLEYDSKEQNQLIPPLGEEKSAVIKPTMNYLFGLTNNTVDMDFIKGIETSVPEEIKHPTNTNQNINVKHGGSGISLETNGILNCLHSTTATINEGGSDSNLTIASNCSEGKNVLLNPGITDSPRYRSLDSLTKKNTYVLDTIPEPGKLVPKIIVGSVEDQSSLSSLTKISTDRENGKLYMNMKTFNLIKNATDQLTEALQQIEAIKLKMSSPGRISVKLKTASKNIKKFVCTTNKESTSSLKLISCPDLQAGASKTRTKTVVAKAVKPVNQRTTTEEKKTTSKLSGPLKSVRSKVETGMRTTVVKPSNKKKP